MMVTMTTTPAPPLTPTDASARLERLGFLLADLYPHAGRDSHLIVALHELPTLQHFDPELVRFWKTGADRRGHPFELRRSTTMPLRTSYSWGTITLIDRFRLENEFVSVGGTVAAEEVSPGRTVAVFSSPGPIFRLGGHSQPVDGAGSQLGAFFARLMVPIDFHEGTEAAISAASPLDRYAAFVRYRGERFTQHPILREEHPAQATSVADEELRLRRSEPAAWERGGRLLDRVGLRA
jgi:hypothetical protein